jgi:hypothetical protein
MVHEKPSLDRILKHLTNNKYQYAVHVKCRRQPATVFVEIRMAPLEHIISSPPLVGSTVEAMVTCIMMLARSWPREGSWTRATWSVALAAPTTKW